jgi:hypothetical protein
MEADCSDYLDPLTTDLNQKMGIAISHWDNNDMRSDFEFGDAPNPTGTCDGSWHFSSVVIYTSDSNEEKENNDGNDGDIDPAPEPEKF